MLNGQLSSFPHNMHVKQYDYILKLSIIKQKFKIKNLKISKTVNLSPANWEGHSLWDTPIFVFRHALVPRSHWFDTAVDTCGSSLVR